MVRSVSDPLVGVVDLRGITKYYGRFIGIRDVTFRLPAGHVVALLGRNGAGKTTLMRVLTGFVAPSAGSVSISGFDVHRDRIRAASQIGYLPENGPVYLDSTPREVLRFFGEARGLARADLRTRIDAIADRCDIRAILDMSMGKLSKGLRQRVGVAQALLHDPPVLIMDEPTAGLDPIQIRHFREHMRELRREKTLLISTHILHEIDAIADRVLVIDRGKLIFDGTPAELGEGAMLESRFCDLTTTTDAVVAAGEAAR
jgi:ABC-2 type transport system ATP-binding protein